VSFPRRLSKPFLSFANVKQMPNGMMPLAISESAEKRARVLIADDHTLVAQGVASLIENDFTVVATVESGREFLKAAAEYLPDIALIDISMPDMTGMEAVQKLQQTAAQCKVIFVSMHSKPEFVREAFSVGAMGYVLKRSAASELIDAMQEVLKGNAYISRQIANSVLSSFVLPRSTSLTERQRQVLRLVSQGRTGKEIAETLNISVKTAQFHKSSIMTKVDVHTTAELTKYAIEQGIIS
jgi:DNA-binding NarL/FixJ family response regulator